MRKRTAKEVYEHILQETPEQAEFLIQQYGRQCAEETLQIASVKANLLYESDATGIISHYGYSYGTEMGEVRVDPESILSTPLISR